MKLLGVSPSISVGRDDGVHALRYDATTAAVNAGLHWSMHSDYAARPVAPLRFVESAVIRIMRESDRSPGAEQSFPIDAALKAVTIHAAYQCRRDHLVGSLTAGKGADLVVLDQDPLATSPRRLGTIRVLETWIDGERRSRA